MATSVPQKDDVERWNVEQVAAWLQQVELADCCEITLKKGIDGHSLLQITEEDLVLWGRDVSIRNRKQIMRLLMQIKNQQLVSTGRHMIKMQNQESEADNDCRYGNNGAIQADSKNMFGNNDAIQADNESMFGNNGAIQADNESMFGNNGAIEADDGNIYGNSDAIIFNKLTNSNKLLHDIQRPENFSGHVSPGSLQIQQLNQREETNDFDTGESSTDSDDVDDFSDDNLEDETEQESTGLQPQEMHAGSDGRVQGDADYGYMTPIARTSTPNFPSLPSRGPPSLPGRPLPTSTSPNHSQPPFLTNLRYPMPQSSSDRPVAPLPPKYIPRTLQPPSRDVSLPGVVRGSSFPNHGSGIQHGGFSGTTSRVLGLSDHAHHGPPPPDSSGHGSAPVLGLSQVSQMPESNVRQQVGRQGITSPFIKPKQQPNLPQGSSAGSLANRPPMKLPVSHNTNSPHNSRPVSPNESGGQGGKDGFLHHPPLSASNSSEGSNSSRVFALSKELQEKFTLDAQSASYAPEKTDHEYEIVDVPPRSYTSAENIGPNSSILQSPDKMPPALPPRNQADGRDTVSRQGQGGGAQQQPGSHNISHNQLHGISAGNAKGRPVPGPPIIIAKRPPAPIPAFQNQPPSSTVTHSRQHESNSEGLNFSQSQLALVSGSPILNSDRKPIPTPTHNISGPAVVPPLAAGHPSSQFTEQYPGPQHQARPHEYLKFDEAPQEIAPAIPNASPLLPHQGSTKVVQIKLQGGGTFDLLPIFRSLMDQPYFRMISRAKSKDTLETADEGMFLIRPSTRSKDPLTLCLRHGGRTYNINIRHRCDGRFALGSEKFNELTFASVEEIIATHRREPIRLQGGQRAILTDSPPNFGHDYIEISGSLPEAFHHHNNQGVGFGRKM